MVKPIPLNPNLEYDKKQAKRLLKAVRQHDQTAILRIRTVHPKFSRISTTDFDAKHVSLADAQLVIAREYGYPSWQLYKNHIGQLMASKTLFDQAIQAVINGDANTLKDLLTKNPNLATATGKNRATLLHYVSANGVEDEFQKTPKNGVEIAEILFDAGANPNVTADFYGGGAGTIPLVCLVSSAHPYEAGVQADLVHIFIKHGAKPNGINNDGYPFATALDFWYPNAFKALVNEDSDLSNLVFAAAAGDTQIVQQMLEINHIEPYKTSFGELITERHNIKSYAFVKACLCGQLDTVKLLLQHNLDINTTIGENRTGLHEASWAGQTEVVSYLIENGADATIKDDQFNSIPIQWAYLRGHKQIVEILLPYSQLSIEIAAQFGLLEKVKELVSANPSHINRVDGSGSPLRAAVSYRHANIVKYLVDNGADATIRNANGMSAIDIAKRIGNQEIIDLLEA